MCNLPRPVLARVHCRGNHGLAVYNYMCQGQVWIELGHMMYYAVSLLAVMSELAGNEC